MIIALIGIIISFTLDGVLTGDFPSNSVNTKNSEVLSFSQMNFQNSLLYLALVQTKKKKQKLHIN